MMTEAPKVRLGELIEECGKRNRDGLLGADDVIGMTITKKIIPTKADVKDTDLSKFLIVEPEQFVYNPRTHGKKIGLGFNDTTKQFLISWNNSVFCVKNPQRVIAKFLYLIFSREEWDRNACFRSWGSSTEVFSWSEFSLMEIPLPDIEVQRDLVAIYDGLQKIVEENVALIAQLESVCHDFVVDCKSKYPKVKLGDYIREINEKNDDLLITLAQGIDVNMQFISAKREAEDKESARIVRNGQFAFNKVIKCNGTKLPIALRNGPDCIISSSYQVFEVKEKEQLLPRFLMLWLANPETQRYCGYKAWGSTRDVFTFFELSNLRIPFPPTEIQNSIVSVYNCLQESKRIVDDARELMKNICPALVQKAAHSA